MTSMDKGARLWLLKTAKENYWRVASWYELDDLIQDGFMCYARVVAKYELRQYRSPTGVEISKSRRVRKRCHIMGLFKSVYTNHINDLARYRGLCAVEVLAEDLASPAAHAAGNSVWDELVPTDSDIYTVEKFIAEAPQPIKTVLRMVLDECKTRRFRSAYRVTKKGRETLNDRLCRTAGLDPQKVDIVTQLRQFLHGQKTVTT